MRFAFVFFLRAYATSDMIFTVLSSIGWIFYWKLSRYALFVQRYKTLKLSTDPLLDRLTNVEDADLKFTAQHEHIALFCGTEPNEEVLNQSLVIFNDTILKILAPSVMLCCLSMFGFFLGGILIVVMSLAKSVVKALGIIILIVEAISIILLLAGTLMTLNKRLCAIEFVYNIRLFLLGSVFVVLVLYKLYEIVLIIMYMRSKAQVSAQQQQAGSNTNGGHVISANSTLPG